MRNWMEDVTSGGVSARASPEPEYPFASPRVKLRTGDGWWKITAVSSQRSAMAA